MTRSDARRCGGPALSRRRATALAALVVGLALAAGCTAARRDLPAPRLPDAAALRAEADAAPQSPEPLYQLALLHYGESQPDAALRALRESLRRDAGYAPSLALLAKLLHETGRSKEGLAYFEKCKLDTLPDPVRLNIALLYVDVGNTVKARKLLQGLETGAWADAAQVNLAYLDLVDEDHVAAAQRLRHAGRYAESAAALNNRAVAELRAGQVSSGARLLEDLAAAYPDLGTAQLNLALLLRHYMFDAEGADRVQAHFDALQAPRLGDAAWGEFSEPASEDAAPPVPRPASPQGERNPD
jgi:predicted Zn-dependent protease